VSRRNFWIGYALLAALYVVPLLWVVHPPAMDLPGHLAIATVVAMRGQPGDPYADLFTVPSWLAPNTLYTYLVGGLGRVLPIDAVSKGLLALAILCTPLSILALCRARRAPGASALAGFALAATFNLVAGFIGFCLALPLVLFMVALAHEQAEHPTGWRAALLSIVSVLLFFAHAQLFLFGVFLAGLAALFAAAPGRRGRAAVGAVLPAAAALVPALPWLLHTSRAMASAGGLRPRFMTPGVMIEYLPIHTFDVLRGHADVLLGALLVAGLLVCRVLRPRRLEQPPLRRNAIDALGAVTLISYFVLPAHVRDQSVINGRQAVLALLLLAGATDVDLGRRAGRVALTGLLALATAYGVLFATATLRLGVEAGDLRALMSRLAPGSRLIALSTPKSAVFRVDVYRHVASYHAAWNRGLVADTFATRSVHPVRTTTAWRAPRPGRRWQESSALDFYDAVLLDRSAASPRLSPLGRAGPFHLYRVEKPGKTPTRSSAAPSESRKPIGPASQPAGR